MARRTVNVVMSKELMVECQYLVYCKWTEAFDAHKFARQEKDDGSRDWQLHHAERLRRAGETLKKWEALRDEANAMVTFNTEEASDGH